MFLRSEACGKDRRNRSTVGGITLADGSVKGEEAPENAACVEEDWRPKRLVRTVLSSMTCSEDFGRQMAREAKRRRFYEAAAKAFLGDGLPWNWSIWKKEFRDFVPILDFIHPLSYLFVTAKTVETSAEDAWSQYLAWMRGPAGKVKLCRFWKNCDNGRRSSACLRPTPRKMILVTS